MGRMKEVYMRIMHENDGQVPEEMTLADMARMNEIEIFNWEEYEREQEKIRLQQIKLDNPREITKVAKTQEFWEAEFKTGKTRRFKKD